MFGMKALKGTQKQREWAEKIRASKLAQMSFEQIALVSEKPNAIYAKFWIENRTKGAAEIVA